MKHFGDIVTVLGLSVLFAMGQTQQAPQPLKLVQKIPLPAVKGRIDHISVDLQGKGLFLAALGNGTMEVISHGDRLNRFLARQGRHDQSMSHQITFNAN